MPRPRNRRCLSAPPLMEGFRPYGMQMKETEAVVLLMEEYEALKLCDYENLRHDEAAIRMNISRPTFTRTYDSARRALAKAVVEGKALVIRGGCNTAGENWFRCRQCKHLMVSADSVRKCNKCNSDQIKNILKEENR